MTPPVVNAVITHFFGRHGRRPQSRPPQQVRIAQPDCKGKHKPSECTFQAAKCHFCKKKGHISKVCLSKNKKTSSRTSQLVTEEGNTYNTKNTLCFTQGLTTQKPFKLQ